MFRSSLLSAIVAAVCLVSTSLNAKSENWTRLDGVRLVSSGSNDGDSFRVWHSGREYVFRLYGVDCPETSLSFPDRVQDQALEFSTTLDQTIAGGKEASRTTEALLATRPFSILTKGEDALGMTRGGRLYAYVVLPSGQDLGGELLSRGLARAHGKTPAHPAHLSGSPSETYASLEKTAKSTRRGLWSGSSTPQSAVTSGRVHGAAPGKQSHVNINTASQSQLESLPGIGPTLALRIIGARPIRGEPDLLRVEGIGPSRLATLRPLIKY